MHTLTHIHTRTHTKTLTYAKTLTCAYGGGAAADTASPRASLSAGCLLAQPTLIIMIIYIYIYTHIYISIYIYSLVLFVSTKALREGYSSGVRGGNM